MTSAVNAPGQTISSSSRYLWAAVGLLGAATIAMGAALVYERAKPEPVTVVAAAAPEQAALLALAPPDTVESVVSVPKEPVAPVEYAQAAPKSIANKPARSSAVVGKTGSAQPAANTAAAPVVTTTTPTPTTAPAQEKEWLPFPQATAQAPKVVCAVCGTVESVTPIQREAAAGSGVGALAGAVLGGLLGNQVGGGDGKTIATVIGAIGGGWAGNAVEKRMKKETAYQVEVRMEDGSTRSVEQSSPPAVGARVTVEGGVIGPAPAPEGAGSGAHPSN